LKDVPLEESGNGVPSLELGRVAGSLGHEEGDEEDDSYRNERKHVGWELSFLESTD
jgi:hypothetical protein